MFDERPKIIDPDKYRRAQYAVREVIRERSLRPSDLINIIERQEDEVIKGAMRKAVEEYPDNEYKSRLAKVQIALNILKEFDVP
jgi:hypothetical protein